jgi:hypothetical protein
VKINLLLVPEHLRKVEKFGHKLTVVLLIFQKTLPLISEAEKDPVWVVKASVNLNKVVSEGLHPDKVTE